MPEGARECEVFVRIPGLNNLVSFVSSYLSGSGNSRCVSRVGTLTQHHAYATGRDVLMDMLYGTEITHRHNKGRQTKRRPVCAKSLSISNDSGGPFVGPSGKVDVSLRCNLQTHGKAKAGPNRAGELSWYADSANFELLVESVIEI